MSDSTNVTHKRVPHPTIKTTGRNYAYAECTCGWVAVHCRTQEDAADTYMGHKMQVSLVALTKGEKVDGRTLSSMRERRLVEGYTPTEQGEEWIAHYYEHNQEVS